MAGDRYEDLYCFYQSVKARRGYVARMEDVNGSIIRIDLKETGVNPRNWVEISR